MCSWVVNLHKKSLAVPTIDKIQSCLVEIGDKPSSFLKSREWIGSFEASIIIDHLYGVNRIANI